MLGKNMDTGDLSDTNMSRNSESSSSSDSTFGQIIASESDSDSESMTSSYSDIEDEPLNQSISDSEGEWSEDVPLREPFEEPTEPWLNIEDARNKTPFDYFKVFFNIMFLKKFASWINMHAIVVQSRPHKPNSRINRWKDTNETELLTFLGILFFMGIVRLNRINYYWRKKNHLVQFSLHDYMSRNRFLLILRMLYFTPDNVSQNIYLAVKPIIKYFNDLMVEKIYPSKQLVIDESMILFRARLGIRQYVKNRRHTFGIKLYFLADSQGLVHRIHMYNGSADSEVGDKEPVDKVVLKLLDPYLYAGHSVYMDNFYTSVGLAESLLNKKTYCTGTLKGNKRKNPSIVIKKNLSKGGFIHRYNRKGVCVMKWRDKREVLTLSTEHTHRMAEVVRQTEGRSIVTSKPLMLAQYNHFMKGVDCHDQMLSCYPCEHKCLRWYSKMGIYILQTMFVNSYLLYGKGTNKKISLEDFREKVLFELLPRKHTSNPRAAFPTHMPSPLERNVKGSIKRRNCVRCSVKNKKRKASGMYCLDCNVGLCIDCYGPYHEENGLLR